MTSLATAAPSGGTTMSNTTAFTLRPGRRKEFVLFEADRRIEVVPMQQIDAQFVLADGSALVLGSDTTPFEEHLAVAYIRDGAVADTVLVGGAHTPGVVSNVHPLAPDRLAFCFHHLDCEVTVRRRRSWFGLKTRWLTLREPDYERERG